MFQRFSPDNREAGVGLITEIEVNDDVVHEVRSYAWEVGNDGNAMGSEVLYWTNARQH